MEGSGFYNNTSAEFELDSDNSTVLLSVQEKVLRAIVLCVILLVGMALNAIVILYTISHPRKLKQSSILFLFGSSVVNLMVLLSQIPVEVVTTFTEEWVFGSTEEERKILCQVNGFFTNLSSFATSYILAIISVDRFILLVKPLAHKRYFKPRLSLGIIVATSIGLVIHQSINIALDRYEFNIALFFCSPTRFVGLSIAVLALIVLAIPFIIIIITTVWTFLSTHRFIRSDHQRRVDAIGTREEEAKEIEDNLYTRQLKNLFGIFSLLLISQVASLLPPSILLVVSGATGPQNLPPLYSFFSVLFIYIGCITNPVIQSYFRKDLRNIFNAACVRVKNCGSCSH